MRGALQDGCLTITQSVNWRPKLSMSLDMVESVLKAGWRFPSGEKSRMRPLWKLFNPYARDHLVLWTVCSLRYRSCNSRRRQKDDYNLSGILTIPRHPCQPRCHCLPRQPLLQPILPRQPLRAQPARLPRRAIAVQIATYGAQYIVSKHNRTQHIVVITR